MYHEAWHHFSQLYLTKEEKVALYGEVREKEESLKDATDLEVEEHIAREFSKFVLAEGKYNFGKFKQRKTIFQKILAFLKKLIGIKDNSLENLFNILSKGEIKNYKSSIDNIMESTLNSEINNSFTNREAEKIKEVLDGTLAHVLRQENVPLTALSNLNNNQLDIVYNWIKEELDEVQGDYIDEEGNPTVPEIVLNLGKIIDNWDSVKDFHFRNSDLIKGRIKNIDIDENGEFVSKEPDEDLKGKNIVDTRESSMEGFYDRVDPEVIAMIQSLPLLNSKGEVIIDEEYGTPKLADSSILINELQEALSGTLPFLISGDSPNTLESKLKKLGKKYPTITYALLPQLELYKTKPSVSSISVATKSYKALGNPKNEIKVTVIKRFKDQESLTPDKYEYSDSLLLNGKFTTAQGELRTNFFTFPIEANSLVSVNTEDDLRVIKDTDENKAKLKNLIENLKPNTILSTFRKVGLSHPFFTSLDLPSAKILLESVLNHLEQKGDITDILSVLQENYPEMIKIVRQIVEADPSKASNVYYNADGELENEVNQWNRMNLLAAGINTFSDFNELTSRPEFAYLKKIGSIESNAILSQIYDKNGKKKNSKVKIQVYNKNGILTLTNPNSNQQEGIKTKRMHVVETAIKDIKKMLLNNDYSTMQLSDKSSFYSLEIPKLIYTSKSIEKSAMFPAFENIIKKEMELVIAYKKELQEYKEALKKDKNAKKTGDLIKLEKLTNNIYDAKAEEFKFGIFHDIFDKDLTDTLLNSGLTQSNINETLIKNKEAISTALYKYFLEDSKEFTSYMNSLSLLGKEINKQFIDHINIPGYSPQGAIEAFVVNQFLFNVATSDLLFGNTYSHKDPFKRISGASGTGTAPITDDAILKAIIDLPTQTLQERFVDFYSKEFGFALQQSRSIERLKQTKFIVFKDEKPNSVYHKVYLQRVDEALATLRTEYKKTNDTNVLNQIKSFEAKRNSIDKAYKNPNQADAFGAMSMDFFRRIALQMSIWNPRLEEIYKKSAAWGIADLKQQYYTDRLNSGELNQEQKDNIDRLLVEAQKEKQENELSEEQLNTVEFTVQKFQYYGDVVNDSFHEVAFHKFELMPLIPQVVSSTQWQKHSERMMLEDADYIVFDSGNKVEKDINKDEFYESESDGKKIVKDVMNKESAEDYSKGVSTYNVRTGNVMNLREQVKMDTEIHSEEIKFGTQIRKLVFNYYDEGKANTGNAEFDKIVEQNKQEYDAIISELIQLEKENIYKAMTLEDVNGQFFIQDKSKFLAFLKKEMEKKSINKAAFEYFQLNPQGEFSKDFDVSIYRRTLENVIVSIINNRLVSQKMTGEMKVQVPDIGFQSYRSQEQKSSSIENGTNGLRFYYEEQVEDLEEVKTVIRKSQVKVALKGNFKKLLKLTHSDGKPITTLERLNEEIRNNRIDSRSLTMVGYRIPTQEHNSVEIMEIAEFLNPLAGSVIVVPTEITAKAGSDFDIDKLNIFLPNLDSEGKYISLEDINEKRQQRLNQLFDYVDSQLNSYEFFIKGEKVRNRERENRLVDLIFENNKQLNYTEQDIEDIKYELALSDISSKETLEKQIRTSLRNKEEERYKKQFRQNRIIELIADSILNETNFINFITPNDTYVFAEEANKIIEMRYPDIWDKEKQEPNFDVKLTKMFNSLESYKKFLALLEQKEALGIAAQANVYSQLFRQSNLKMKDFETVFEVARDEDKNISLAKANSVNGIPKSSTFGQTINYNVDAANSPIFAYLNTGLITAPVMMFMHHISINPLVTLAFVNQPILVRYTNDLKLQRESKIIDLKIRDKKSVYNIDIVNSLRKEMLDIMNKVFPKGFTIAGEPTQKGEPTFLTLSADNLLDYDLREKKFKTDFKQIFEKVSGRPYKAQLNFLERNIEFGQELKSLPNAVANISKDEKKQKDFLLYTLSQLILLQEFLMYQEKADMLRQVQDSVKYDTAKSLSAADAQAKINLYKTLEKSGEFINLERLRYNSTTSPFAVQQDMIDILEFLMPVTSGKEFNKFVAEKLETEFSRKSQSDKASFVRDFTSGLVQFIFQTMQNETFKQQFKLIYNADITQDKEGNPRTFEDFYKTFTTKFYTRLVTLKNNDAKRAEQGLPKLFEKYSLLENVFINASPIKPEVKNIGIKFPSKEVKAENEYIDQWRELAQEPGVINIDNSNSQTIKAFMEELALFAFLQSGLNYSYLSFSRIADNTALNDLLSVAKEELLQKAQEFGWEAILNNYYDQFKQNNNKYRTYKSDLTERIPDPKNKLNSLYIANTSPKLNTLGIESFRGQLYKEINWGNMSKTKEISDKDINELPPLNCN